MRGSGPTARSLRMVVLTGQGVNVEAEERGRAASAACLLVNSYRPQFSSLPLPPRDQRQLLPNRR